MAVLSMEKTDTNNKKGLKILVSLILAAILFFIADMVYDGEAVVRAEKTCGKGNVQSVSTQGFFKEEVVCDN